MSFLSIVFVLFLPETKGRSLQEIENNLAHYRPSIVDRVSANLLSR